MIIRSAEPSDIEPLVQLEKVCFETDRLSRRSFRRFLNNPRDSLLLSTTDEGELMGYGLLLQRRGTHLARLYSLAVAPDARGRGVARALLRALESAAAESDSRFIRLEVAVDNGRAIGLYESEGYRPIGRKAAYYEDGTSALQMEKRLHRSRPHPEGLPYFAQTTPFTCGPAALMMAMQADAASQPMNQAQEIQLWREATTVYMTTGLGGTSPFGLALAAARRGWEAQVWASHLEPPFLNSVRARNKQDLMRLVHDQFIEESRAAGVALVQRELSQADIPALLADGWRLLLLISTWRLNRNKAPHWVWLVDYDGQVAYLNDPDVDLDDRQSALDNRFMPVGVDELDAMTRYGANRYRATVLIRRRSRPSGAPAAS